MADSELVPAGELAARAGVRFPNESAAYRAARTALLAEEIELRRHIERVAEMRRALPLGGAVPDSYRFIDETGGERALGDLFGGHDTLIAYNWMFGPQRRRPCPMCTGLVAGLAAAAADLMQRVGLVVIGRSPIERQIAFKVERGWRDLRFAEALGDAFAADFHALAPDGSEWPALNVFAKREGVVYHFWGGEMNGETMDPGQDPRGAPDPMLLWTMLDLTPAGRGRDWYPKLSY
ncbi:DUF899 family protein [Sphingomonas quercus]|uniref:DUF899 family protein n=1 Tax=Sphingomonas quercus TaxID=2842451 RepID=A0ABS6BI93_9SPHN|nr:DUF899 family protein [Sphingomonas quercus]MBU3077899.1 DUF899 family protein [Sphingomonas quercus]